MTDSSNLLELLRPSSPINDPPINPINDQMDPPNDPINPVNDQIDPPKSDNKVANKMIKIKEKNMTNPCKRLFYLSSGVVMHLESCIDSIMNYYYTCKYCRQSLRCNQCKYKRIANKVGKIFLCKSCTIKNEKNNEENNEKKHQKQNILSIELSEEIKERIQVLLYETNKDFWNKIWYSNMPIRIKYDNLPNGELKDLLTEYKYHFVIPKQVTIFYSESIKQSNESNESIKQPNESIKQPNE